MLNSIFKSAPVKLLSLVLGLILLPCINRASDSASNNYLSQSDAEKILGQSARLTENSTATKREVLRYTCTYTGMARDKATGKKENLYYLLEKYKIASSAQKVFAEIITQNRENHKIEKLGQVGDEAILLSDHINYHTIIVRKNNKILRLKVNKVTSMTSLDELKKVAMGTALKL